MGPESWRLFYQSDLQALYAPIVVPVLFLGWFVASGRARPAPDEGPEARFLRVYTLVFGIATVVDPITTGPLAKLFGLPGSATMLPFVLLGDYRVFALLFALSPGPRSRARALAVAALWTLVVPITAWCGGEVLALIRPDLTGQRLWLIYELCFLAMALWLRTRVVPARTSDPELRRGLQALCSYVAVYYALWAGSDALILFAGQDAGWLLRSLPNQLYYALWVPFAWLTVRRALASRDRAWRPSSPGSRR